MPIKECQINGESGFKWGDQGKCYTGPDAKKKAIAQGIAIGDFVDATRVSIDYDDTLSTDKGKKLAERLLAQGLIVYIITRRSHLLGSPVYTTAKELGIPSNRVIFTDGKLKWETIKRLNISRHYDNNQNEIDKINQLTDANGILFKASLQEFKKWRSDPQSSNVDKIMYNDETNEMVIKFNDGSYYTYFGVDFALFQDIFQGNGICRTEGSNQWGEWWVGKSPSVGAAVYELLVEAGIPYMRGGSLK